jgi:hypothetical protein
LKFFIIYAPTAIASGLAIGVLRHPGAFGQFAVKRAGISATPHKISADQLVTKWASFVCFFIGYLRFICQQSEYPLFHLCFYFIFFTLAAQAQGQV